MCALTAHRLTVLHNRTTVLTVFIVELGGSMGLKSEKVHRRDGDGVISAAELSAYTEKVQEHAQQQHAEYVSALEQQQAVEQQLRAQLKLAQQQGYEVKDVPAAPVNQVPAKSKSSFCVVQ